MSKFAVLAVVCLTFGLAWANEHISCYQCGDLKTECELAQAGLVKCAGKGSYCSTQVKKGSTDTTKAIRKCVIVDSAGKYPCQDGYDCYTCQTDKCVAEPTEAPKNSESAAAAPVSIPIACLAAVMAAVYAAH